MFDKIVANMCGFCKAKNTYLNVARKKKEGGGYPQFWKPIWSRNFIDKIHHEVSMKYLSEKPSANPFPT